MDKEKELELKVQMFNAIIKGNISTTNDNGRFIKEIAYHVNDAFEILNK